MSWKAAAAAVVMVGGLGVSSVDAATGQPAPITQDRFTLVPGVEISLKDTAVQRSAPHRALTKDGETVFLWREHGKLAAVQKFDTKGGLALMRLFENGEVGRPFDQGPAEIERLDGGYKIAFKHDGQFRPTFERDAVTVPDLSRPAVVEYDFSGKTLSRSFWHAPLGEMMSEANTVQGIRIAKTTLEMVAHAMRTQRSQQPSAPEPSAPEPRGPGLR